MFEGDAVVSRRSNRTRRPGTPLTRPGAWSTRAWSLLGLLASDKARLKSIQAESRERLAPEAASARATSDQKIAARIVKKTGAPLNHVLVSRAAAIRAGLRRFSNWSSTTKIGTKTVAEVGALNPERYVGETLADPLEGVAYGRCKAKVMAGKEGGYIIHSFAHGGMVYRLSYDEAAIEGIIDAMEAKQGLLAFAEAMADAMLDEVLSNACVSRPRSNGCSASAQSTRPWQAFIPDGSVPVVPPRRNAMPAQTSASFSSRHPATPSLAPSCVPSTPSSRVRSTYSPPLRGIDGRPCPDRRASAAAFMNSLTRPPTATTTKSICLRQRSP